MKTYKILSLNIAAVLCCTAYAQAGSFFGAGATFPNALYQAWGKAYKSQTGDVLVYTPVGSGRGIAEIVAKRTDFGATDKPLTRDEQDKYNLVQFPMAIGGVVPAINLRKVADGQLQLDGNVLAQIYLGKITRWNDAALVALNPGMALPNEMINVIYREDKSGTTFNFTNYLSKVSAEWNAAMGEGMTMAWQVGTGAQGTDALAKKVARTPNSIGYLDYADIQSQHLTAVKMKNRQGVFVAPTARSFAAAASSANWQAGNGFYEILTDQIGPDSWPMTTATFILLERKPTEPSNARVALRYFDWAYRNGDDIAHDLSFVPLPDSVADMVRAEWKDQIMDRAGTLQWQ